MTNQSVYIVGGGAIGVCTAYYLLKKSKERGLSVKVHLVEQEDIACASSGLSHLFIYKIKCKKERLVGFLLVEMIGRQLSVISGSNRFDYMNNSPGI